MKLQRLITKGLKGLHQFPAAGLTFNFGSLPPGLIAVTGPNGAGKTTFLEAPIAGLFGKFPSRPECALLDSVDGKDAFIDVEVAVADRGVYRARVNVDGVKRVTDATLERRRADGRTERLNDGKVSTFKPAVEAALPALPLLLASAFAAQNKAGSFATLEKKERRDLFARLLGLDRYEQMATAARAAALLIDRTLTAQRTLRDAVAARTTAALATALHREANDLQGDLSQQQADRDRLTAECDGAATDVDDLQIRAARYTAAAGELRQLALRQADQQGGHQRLVAERAQLATDEGLAQRAVDERYAQAIRRVEAQRAALPTVEALDRRLQTQLDAIDQTLETALANEQRRIDNNQALLAREGAIRASADDWRTASELAVALESQLTAAQATEREAFLGLEAARQAYNTQERRADDRDRARGDLAALDGVPCHGADAFAACRFLQQAKTARERLQTDLADVPEALDRASGRVAAAGTAHDQAVGETHARRQQLERVRADIARCKPDAERLPRLEAAKTRVEELLQAQAAHRRAAEDQRVVARADRQRRGHEAAQQRDEAATTEADAATTRAADLRAITARADAQRDDVDRRTREVVAAQADLADQVTQLERVRDAAAPAQEALVGATRRLADLRAALDVNTRQLATTEAAITAFHVKREQFRADQAEGDRLTALVEQLETDLVEWQAYARVFGREGLPTLEIDAAGPGVSALANDLLQACFGTRFTVDLVTQDAKADGKGMKEVFELRVWDAARGGEAMDLALLSGGEQVVIDEAVRAAVALFINQRNELPIRTLFRDETTGALDPENALRYVAMLRRLLERSGAEQLLFITHDLDAAALADVQVHLQDGRIDVRYPPFTSSGQEAA